MIAFIVKYVGMIIFGLALATVLIFVGAFFAQLFWNMFCGYVHLPKIGYWQMWGLMMFLDIIATIFRSKVELDN